jgi:hypothetical protein
MKLHARKLQGAQAGEIRPVAQPKPLACELVGDEGEHVRRHGIDRRLVDDGKNVFRSRATARNVFGRQRPATNSNQESTSGSARA